MRDGRLGWIMTFLAMIQAVAAVIALRQDAPALDVNAARAMTPAALADVLLAPGHPTIVGAVVHPAHMEAPALWVTKVELLAAPELRSKPGLCAATLYTVAFEDPGPASSKFDGRTPIPVRPASLATEMLFRLPSLTPLTGSQDCNAPMEDFFHLNPSMQGREFELLRLLASARQVAKAGDALPFDLSFKDKMADDFERFASSEPPKDGRVKFVRIPNARAALSEMPLEDISYIGVDSASGDPATGPPSPLGDCKQRVCTAEILAAECWRARVAFTAHRIVSLYIERAIPAPF